ncbi:Chymotrypsin inhibitor [Apis cerana cerana]|uniref:Chymotrypsin inhibitor n=1 Tax=Apis cerana cerana TaxID=94128 RepID=A0A2A3EQ63_APICC|nr:Chymotrypsin inhibitor [Apis cerana cerana]
MYLVSNVNACGQNEQFKACGGCDQRCGGAYPDGNVQNEKVKCGPNEEFTNCGSECVDTCEKPASPVCNLKCVIGCQCKPGFVRNRESKNPVSIMASGIWE